MSEFEDIQRLIRLKRFEKPEEDFTEKFLEQFHQRQRAEMLQKSSLALFMERVGTWWENLLVPKWGMAMAAAAVCAVSVWAISRPAETKPAAAVTTAAPATPEKPFVAKMDLSNLPPERLAEKSKPQQGTLQQDKLMKVPGTPSSLPATNADGKASAGKATPAVQSGTERKLGQ